MCDKHASSLYFHRNSIEVLRNPCYSRYATENCDDRLAVCSDSRSDSYDAGNANQLLSVSVLN